MRPLTEEETKTLFLKLSEYIGKNIERLINRSDERHCFRLIKVRKSVRNNDKYCLIFSDFYFLFHSFPTGSMLLYQWDTHEIINVHKPWRFAARRYMFWQVHQKWKVSIAHYCFRIFGGACQGMLLTFRRKPCFNRHWYFSLFFCSCISGCTLSVQSLGQTISWNELFVWKSRRQKRISSNDRSNTTICRSDRL